MARTSLLLTLLVAVCTLSFVAAQDLSKFPNVRGQNLSSNKYAKRVKDCYLKDKTKFEQCLLQFWKEVAPVLKSGIPELKLPVMDPLVLDRLDFNEQSSAVKADARFTTIVVKGASQVIPKAVKVDTKAKLVTISLSFPFLNSTGDYFIKGTVMLMPIDGQGKFELNMTNIDAVVKAHVIQKGTGIKTDRIELDFNIAGIVVKLYGLLGGDSVGDAINNMLNDNSQQILTDLKPSITKRFQTVFHNLTADAFVDMPPDAFIS